MNKFYVSVNSEYELLVQADYASIKTSGISFYTYHEDSGEEEVVAYFPENHFRYFYKAATE